MHKALEPWFNPENILQRKPTQYLERFKTPWRISGMAGILFVALSFIASGINSLPPGYNNEKTTIVIWFAKNGQQFRFGHFLAGLAFLLFYFPFYAGLCARPGEAEGNPKIWTRVTWAGAIMSPAAGTIAGTFIISLALLEGSASSEVTQFALAANFYAYIVSGAFSGITMIGAAVIILRTSVFRPWLGWLGLLIGAAAISSTAL